MRSKRIYYAVYFTVALLFSIGIGVACIIGVAVALTLGAKFYVWFNDLSVHYRYGGVLVAFACIFAAVKTWAEYRYNKDMDSILELKDRISAEEFDHKFDSGEDITEHLDTDNIKRG